MKSIFIAALASLLVAVIVHSLPEGSFSVVEYEHLTSAKMFKSDALVYAAKDCYVAYKNAAEMEIGKSVSEYEWLQGEVYHPSRIFLSSSKGYSGFMERVEKGLNRIVLAGLIFRSQKSSGPPTTIYELSAKLSEPEFKRLESQAKLVVIEILSPYKENLARVSLAGTRDLVKSYPIPKEPKLETWHTLFQDSLASNSQ